MKTGGYPPNSGANFWFGCFCMCFTVGPKVAAWQDTTFYPLDDSKHNKKQWFFTLLDLDPPKRCRVSVGDDLASMVPSGTPSKVMIIQQFWLLWRSSPSGGHLGVS